MRKVYIAKEAIVSDKRICPSDKIVYLDDGGNDDDDESVCSDCGMPLTEDDMDKFTCNPALTVKTYNSKPEKTT